MIAADEPCNSRIMTVSGLVRADLHGAVDAHNHVWIEKLDALALLGPVLNNPTLILHELSEYKHAGGVAIIDCQPGGCGRNGNRLAWLAAQSGVHIVACTGFHLQRYYPVQAEIWRLGVDALARVFIGEIEMGLQEVPQAGVSIKAGFIKIALEEKFANTPSEALEAATAAAQATGAAIQVHTERGSDAEAALAYFVKRAVRPEQIILCHMDKRPDFGLHQELIQSGALLEYDTFYRSKYQPEENVWPLICRIAAAGLEHGIALATDIAEPSFWRAYGGQPGLVGMFALIFPRLQAAGIPLDSVQQMTGKNILKRLAVY